jgi:Zn-dependent protease with chaperone function
MNNKLRIFLAFLVAPLSAVFVLHLFQVIPIVFSTNDGDGIGFRAMSLGLAPKLLIYIGLLMISVPVFIFVRHFIKWRFWSCMLSPVIVVTLLGVWLLLGDEGGVKEYFTNLYFIVGSIAGTAMYGLVFWTIIPKN